MRTRTRILTLATALPLVFGVIAPVASADPYPLDCEKQTVLKVDYDTGLSTSYTSIQEAIDEADGNPAGGSVGDTVIVCAGTYYENITIGTIGDESKVNVSVRSWDGPHETTIVGDPTAGPVVTINANGVHFGGSGLGFTIEGDLDVDTTGDSDATGIQVGFPEDIDPSQDDDQEIAPDPTNGDEDECNFPVDPGQDPNECRDEEDPAAQPSNVTVAGNEIGTLVPETFEGTVAAIAVNNTNNTNVFRNLIKKADVFGDSLAYGIVFSDFNANNVVVGNAVKDLTQEGGTCPANDLASPSVGAVGISIQDEALDAIIYNNSIEKVQATCTAVGAYSSAWGSLENDRNGQQIPIVTDVQNNELKEIEGTESAAIVLASVVPTDLEEPSVPSSFRVTTNDIDKTGTAVAVLGELNMYSYIEQNNFDNSDIGLFYAGSLNLDATNNWWGCHEGPVASPDHCAEIAGGGTAYYNPWTRKHIEHAGSHAGDHAGDH
jgi:hypothetical protein